MNRIRSFDAKIIEISDGNIEHSHIYLRSALNLIPSDAIGGTNASRLGDPISVQFVPGPLVKTDLPNDKLFLRCRSEVAQFFKDAGVEAGDFIIFIRLGERRFEIKKAP